MNATPLEPLAFGIGNITVSQFTKSFMDSEIGSSSHSAGLLYLLPPCLIMLAVDALAHYSQRQAQIPDKEQSAKHKQLIARLTAKVHQSVLKIEELDRQLLLEQAHSLSLSRSLRKKRNFARHRQRLEAYKAKNEGGSDCPPRYTAEMIPPAETPATTTTPSAPFTNFCQKLLYQNELWKQQREIKKLQLALHDIKAATASNAFQAFCDRLLLSNMIWKQQKAINSLMAEAESLRRTRDAAVTRAAKQMVQDVTKERLTEEYVRDLIAEVGECKQAITSLRAEHEKEIRELADLYRQDCRRMTEEIERLKLAQQSMRMEQELSNEMEDELIARLSLAEGKLSSFEREGRDAFAVCECDDGETMSGSELERMSNMSTSTCVGSGGDLSPYRKAKFDDDSISRTSSGSGKTRMGPLKIVLRETHAPSSPLQNSSAAKSLSRKSDPVLYAGFSFNPLFFGGASSARSEDSFETHSLESKSMSNLKIAAKTAENADQHSKRAQWKV